MTRAFATGLAVATIRPIVVAFFATSRLTGLTQREIFGIAFWLGFIANAVAAEILIRRARRDAVMAGSRYGRARRDAGPSALSQRALWGDDADDERKGSIGVLDRFRDEGG